MQILTLACIGKTNFTSQIYIIDAQKLNKGYLHLESRATEALTLFGYMSLHELPFS